MNWSYYNLGYPKNNLLLKEPQILDKFLVIWFLVQANQLKKVSKRFYNICYWKQAVLVDLPNQYFGQI